VAHLLDVAQKNAVAPPTTPFNHPAIGRQEQRPVTVFVRTGRGASGRRWNVEFDASADTSGHLGRTPISTAAKSG
jgi:hypothetical protein